MYDKLLFYTEENLDFLGDVLFPDEANYPVNGRVSG
jgi:hypothetical protein